LSCDDKFLPLTLRFIKLNDTDAIASRYDSYFVNAVPRYVEFGGRR